jgi:imidazoleglycerol-phosphate dehydratase
MTVFSKNRETKETTLNILIDDQADFKNSIIDTGVGFFDHMLTLFSFHSEIYFKVKAEGDLHIDAHHTVEDIGIVLGQLLRELYVSKQSYTRYGSMYLPMDESLARVVLDLSGRPHLSFEADFSREKTGDFDTELVEEFFNAVAMNARMTLHIDLLKKGNSHHEIEAIFKAFARSLKIALTPTSTGVPSSKGVIE